MNKYEVTRETEEKVDKKDTTPDAKQDPEDKPRIEPLHRGEKKKIVIKKPKIVIADDKK